MQDERTLSPRRGEGRGEGAVERASLLGAVLLLAACGSDFVIGIEREIQVKAAVVDPATGDLLQAGSRRDDLWYARVKPDGSIVREQRVDFEGGEEAVNAVVVLPNGWAVAGYATRADGRRTAWVRVLDGSDGEVWTKTYDQNGGWEAQGLAVDPVGTLVVTGTESGGHGFVQRLDESGGVRWKYSTNTDLQGMVTNLRIFSAATIGQSVQRVVTVGERAFSDGVKPELSQWSLMGDFYDSLRLDMAPGTSRGLLLDLDEATVCTQKGDDVVVRRSKWIKVPEVRKVVLHVDGAKLELGGCAAASDGDLLVGATAVFPDGRRVARAAKVERTAAGIRWERDVSAPDTVTVAGVAADANGGGYLYGHTDAPLRRWTGKIF
jgi:hypothetical protein